MPLITLLMMTRPASAQLELRESWAVVEFTNATKFADLGKTASEAVNTEIGRLNRYETVLPDIISRKTTELGLQAPVTKRDELVRLGQNLPSNVIVNGEIVDARVVAVGQSKKAEVKMRVIVRDVASGLEINGAALLAESAVRTGDVADETLLNDAVSAGAFNAVSSIARNTLPRATVLNTTDRMALINQGTRTGFKSGQQVIVTRGREQVATANIDVVEPDSAFIKVTRQTKGIQPGDRVQVIFEVPELKRGWNKSGSETIAASRKAGSSSGIVTVLLVLGLAFFLLGQGRGGNNNTVTGLTADLPTNTFGQNENRLAVNLNWKPDNFIGEPYRLQWQIWRNDVADAPVLVVDGRRTSATDDGLNTERTGAYVANRPTPEQCSDPGTDATVVPRALSSGVPYQYSIELVYRINKIDDPYNQTTTGGSSGGLSGGGTGTSTGGSTGTSTGGSTGTSTGGSTGTTSGSSGSTGGSSTFCVRVLPRVTMNGTITPFTPVTLNAPDDGVTLAVPTVFQWFSARSNQSSTIPIQYLLQFSKDPLFSTGNTVNVIEFEDLSSVGFISTPRAISEVTTVFPGTTDIYWRVGVRSLIEKRSYIFGAVRKFKRPVNPPNP